MVRATLIGCASIGARDKEIFDERSYECSTLGHRSNSHELALAMRIPADRAEPVEDLYAEFGDQVSVRAAADRRLFELRKPEPVRQLLCAAEKGSRYSSLERRRSHRPFDR
jgi:hypothetical protein